MKANLAGTTWMVVLVMILMLSTTHQGKNAITDTLISKFKSLNRRMMFSFKKKIIFLKLYFSFFFFACGILFYDFLLEGFFDSVFLCFLVVF